MRWYCRYWAKTCNGVAGASAWQARGAELTACRGWIWRLFVLNGGLEVHVHLRFFLSARQFILVVKNQNHDPYHIPRARKHLQATPRNAFEGKREMWKGYLKALRGYQVAFPHFLSLRKHFLALLGGFLGALGVCFWWPWDA